MKKKAFLFVLLPLLWLAVAPAEEPSMKNLPTYRFVAGRFVVESWVSETKKFNGDPLWMNRGGKAEEVSPRFYGSVRNTLYRIRMVSGSLPAGLRLEEVLQAYPTDAESQGRKAITVKGDGLASDVFIRPASSRWRTVNQKLFLIYGSERIQFAQFRIQLGDNGEIELIPINSKIEEFDGVKQITFLQQPE